MAWWMLAVRWPEPLRPRKTSHRFCGGRFGTLSLGFSENCRYNCDKCNIMQTQGALSHGKRWGYGVLQNVLVWS